MLAQNKMCNRFKEIWHPLIKWSTFGAFIYWQFQYLPFAPTVQRLHDISDSFPMGENYTDIQSAELYLCIINHLTGRPVRIHWAKQQAHSNISRFIKHSQDTFLTAYVIDANHQSLWINQRAWECREAYYVWVGECANVHACVSSKAVTGCVWWKAPDVACLLTCNKKARLGQKAKEANGREKRVEWRKEGISLKEIMEGWAQGASFS